MVATDENAERVTENLCLSLPANSLILEITKLTSQVIMRKKKDRVL